MQAVLSNRSARQDLLAAQDAALDRLLEKDFARIAVGFVEQVLASPRRPPAPVTFDFWRQYALAGELEIIREVRPAAFQALPFAPAQAGRAADLEYRDVGPRP
jgi:hypothetical protein